VLGRQTNPHKAIRDGALPYAVIYYVLTAGRLDNRGERYNPDLLMPSVIPTGKSELVSIVREQPPDLSSILESPREAPF
jgi:hypothetical protein